MSNNPFVSVIIPCFNGEKYLAETLQSVLAQTYRPLDVIVVDDASTDRSADIAASFGPPVRVLRNDRNMERSWSRNRGIHESTADYIAFVDADDLWHPQKLEIQMQQFTAHPACGLMYSGCLKFHTVDEIKDLLFTPPPPSRATVHHRFDRSLVRGNRIPCLSVLMRKQAWLNVGGFREPAWLQGCEDYDLWLQVAHRYDVLKLESILSYYRIHGAQTTANWWRNVRTAFRVRSDYIQHYPEVLAEKSADERWLDCYKSLRNESLNFFRRGEWRDGIRAWLMLIRHSPFSRHTYHKHALSAFHRFVHHTRP